jgi:hypothetical protein
MAAAQGPIEVDGATLVIVLGSRTSMRLVTENNPAGAGHLEPPFQAHRLCLKDIRPTQEIPQCRLTVVNEKVPSSGVYSGHEMTIVDVDEGGVAVVAAMLGERAIVEG